MASQLCSHPGHTCCCVVLALQGISLHAYIQKCNQVTIYGFQGDLLFPANVFLRLESGISVPRGQGRDGTDSCPCPWGVSSFGACGWGEVDPNTTILPDLGPTGLSDLQNKGFFCWKVEYVVLLIFLRTWVLQVHKLFLLTLGTESGQLQKQVL